MYEFEAMINGEVSPIHANIGLASPLSVGSLCTCIHSINPYYIYLTDIENN